MPDQKHLSDKQKLELVTKYETLLAQGRLPVLLIYLLRTQNAWIEQEMLAGNNRRNRQFIPAAQDLYDLLDVGAWEEG